MSRYVMSHHVTSYHFESRGTVTRPTLHCQLTSSTRNQFKLSMTVFVGCPEGCRYHTASAVYDLVRLWFNKFFRLFVFPFVCSIISSVIYASCMHIRSFVHLFIRSSVCYLIRLHVYSFVKLYDRTDQTDEKT